MQLFQIINIKKIFLLFLVSVIWYLSSGQKASAQVVGCDPSKYPASPCTVCAPASYDQQTCIIDANKSTCEMYGYNTDLNYCNTYTGSMGMCQSAPMANCVEAPVCKNLNDYCSGPPGTPADCCGNLECRSRPGVPGELICQEYTSCQNLGEVCTGTVGTQGSCCDEKQFCQISADGTNTCQLKREITGYFCDHMSLCLPCYSTSSNFGCVPPEYDTFSGCDSACRGLIPIKFSCNPILGGCNESEFGTYSDLALCEQNCDLIPPWFCNTSSNTASGIDTGLGCVTFCAGTFAAKALGWSSITTAGIAFIVILVAIIMFLVSAGDSKKIQAAKELLFSALGGLFLIIIGIVLLNFIGVNVLKIDTLGFKLDAVCKPITFEKPSPTPTPRPPTPKPTVLPTLRPTSPPPTVIPSPTRIPPTPTPCPLCVTSKTRYRDCREDCKNGTNVGSCTYKGETWINCSICVSNYTRVCGPCPEEPACPKP